MSDVLVRQCPVTPAEREKIRRAAEEIAAGLPPLTAEQRDTLRVLLRPMAVELTRLAARAAEV